MSRDMILELKFPNDNELITQLTTNFFEKSFANFVAKHTSRTHSSTTAQSRVLSTFRSLKQQSLRIMTPY